MTEQYQGILEVKGGHGYDIVYFAPTQKTEYRSHVSNGKLLDGREVINGRWLNAPLDRKGIDLVVIEMLAESHGLPEDLLETFNPY